MCACYGDDEHQHLPLSFAADYRIDHIKSHKPLAIGDGRFLAVEVRAAGPTRVVRVSDVAPTVSVQSQLRSRQHGNSREHQAVMAASRRFQKPQMHNIAGKVKTAMNAVSATAGDDGTPMTDIAGKEDDFELVEVEEPFLGEGRALLRVKIALKEFAICLIDDEPKELLLATLTNTECTLRILADEHTFDLQVASFQLDNMTDSAFPVTLTPSPPISTDVPFVYLRIEQSLSSNSSDVKKKLSFLFLLTLFWKKKRCSSTRKLRHWCRQCT